MRHKKLFISFIFLLFIQISFAQIPKNFKLLEIGKISGELFFKLNAGDDFSVKKVDGKLSIEQSKHRDGVKLNLKEGLLVALNFGEFGGYLEYAKHSGGFIKEELSNINNLFEFDGSIYYTSGTSHLGFEIGNLYKLEIEKDSFRTTNVIDFKSSLYVSSVYKKQIFVVCSSGFYVVENFQATRAIKTDFWNGLYPNSIAVLDEEHIYIGMRSGIAHINLNKKIIKYYEYKGAKFEKYEECDDVDITNSLNRHIEQRKNK